MAAVPQSSHLERLMMHRTSGKVNKADPAKLRGDPEIEQGYQQGNPDNNHYQWCAIHLSPRL